MFKKCNSVLFGLRHLLCHLYSVYRTKPLGLFLDWITGHTSKPALQRLHWLPVKAGIQFKIATVVHAILNQRGPAYLNNIIKLNREESGRRHLRSSTTNAAVVTRTRTQFGKRAFSACCPSIWNQIPPHIRNLHSAPAFRKALNTYLFPQTTL